MSSRNLLYVAYPDDNFTTYVTNYLTTGVCWIQAGSLLYLTYPLFTGKPNIEKLTGLVQNRSVTAAALFGMYGLGNLFAGLTHQYYPHEIQYPDTDVDYYVLWSLSLLCQFRDSFDVQYLRVIC